mgnify:CR=1 FL=1
MTYEEIKEIEKFFGKPIDEIDWLDIPTYLRKKEEKEWWAIMEKAEELKQENDQHFKERTNRKSK